MFSRKRSDAFAGLAIYKDSLRYVELAQEAGELWLARRESVPLPEGCILRGCVRSFDLLESAFRVLKKSVRRFPCPVTLGIPPGNAVLKLLDYPPMPMEEVHQALSLEFNRHFPWPREKAVLNIAGAEAPLATPHPRMAVLTAAAGKDCARNLLWMAQRARLPIAALEPVDAALFRALSNGAHRDEMNLVLNLEPEVHTIILGYRGRGILFRSILNKWKDGIEPDPGMAGSVLARDIHDTLTFAGNRYHGLDVHRLILGGSLSADARLRTVLEAETSLTVSPSDAEAACPVHGPGYAGFEAAVGLALRGNSHGEAPEKASFDLRPAEYVEREHRRHSFSFTRLLVVTLSLAFVLSCGGYTVLAIREYRALSMEAAARREDIADLEKRQSALTAELSRLREQETAFSRKLGALKQDLPVLEVMDALERLTGPGVSVNTVHFARSAGEPDDICIVTVEAGSHDEGAALLLMENLSKKGLFDNVEMLSSTQDRREGSAFTLLLTLKLGGSNAQ